ncbi:autotransporter family protein [Mesorhizobium xinjiangense]|uniref:autotransporter family protein n=1 Tax=Mesorhizobium xinjiangense TaxID=2678685 RepID=UPI0012ECC843|nr:autotransporter outer membrane beta-barrel domain-containing protein [Mesorhizobium xinjiangense]
MSSLTDRIGGHVCANRTSHVSGNTAEPELCTDTRAAAFGFADISPLRPAAAHFPPAIRRGLRVLLLATTAFVSAPAAVRAQTADWTGQTSTDWFTGANWSTGDVPDFDDDVRINTQTSNPAVVAASPSQGANVDANSLVIGDGADADGRLSIEALDPDNSFAFISVQTQEVEVGTAGGSGILDISMLADGSNIFSRVHSFTNLVVGGGDGSVGTVNILSGGKNRFVSCDSCTNVFLSATGTVGQNGGTGTVNVIDAAWRIDQSNRNGSGPDGLHIGVGPGSAGMVNVLSGGKISYSTEFLTTSFPATEPIGIVIGEAGGTGTLTVSGSNAAGPSLLTTGAGLIVGHGEGSVGSLNILGGSQVSSFNVNQFEPDRPTGGTEVGVDGGTGSILVSGAGSVLYVAGTGNPSNAFDPERAETGTEDLIIGASGNGSLTIADGGLVHVGTVRFTRIQSADHENTILEAGTPNGIVVLGQSPGSIGTLNFGAPAGQTSAAPGTLAAAGIVFGDGTASIVFNHTANNFQFDLPISGEGQIDVYSGTTTVSSDNSAGFSRTRRVFDMETFEFVEVADVFPEGFSGLTNLHGGALILADDFAVGTSAIQALGNSTLGYGVDAQAGRGVSIANTIAVDPGVTLALQAASGISATQTGLISGEGNINKTGPGTLTLTANSSLTGTAAITDGVLALSGAGELSQAERVVANATFDISAAAGGASIRSLAGSGTVELGAQRLTITAANDLFSGIIQGTGGLTLTGGTEGLSGPNSYSGPTFVRAGTLRAEASDTFSFFSAHRVASGGTLDLGGFDQSIPSLTNAGLVRTGGQADTSLTVTGPYVGQGGTLNLNTFLAGDGSPSDRLVVDGTATGSTGVIITNIGGPGELTTGNGILVVDDIPGQTTAPRSFQLAAPAVAGPYEYTLERGSLDSTGPHDWFLRSALDCAHVPNHPGCAGPPGPTPPGDDPGSLPPPIPNYRQEVSLDMAIQPMAVIYGRQLIGTLHARVGAEEQLKGRADLWQNPAFNGSWGRVFGRFGHRDGHPLGIYGGGPEFDYAFGGLQTGMDFYADEHQDGSRDHAGLYFAYGYGTMDVNHNLREVEFDGGDDRFNAVSVGGYWTHFGATGWYIDAVTQATFYDMTSSSSRGLPEGQTDGTGLAASLEAGYPFDLGGGWIVEPQAQLIYQNIQFDDINDGAAIVRFDDVDSLVGRVGARTAKTWSLDAEDQGNGGSSPRLLTGWGQVNLWQEFLGEATTEFSSASGFIPFSQDLEETWIEAGFGASLQLSVATTLYGSINYDTTFDGDAWGVDGKVGLRVNW